MKNNLAPIILFVYNRFWHTKKTVEALRKNYLAKDSLLYIFSDGPKTTEDFTKVNEVRNYLETFEKSNFRKVKIFKSRKNKGLADSIIFGVTKIISKFGKVIVLEDDLVTSPVFLDYMNGMLEKFNKEKRIYSITGYNHPFKIMKIPKNYSYDIYFNPRAASWSWATWENRWRNVDWEVKDFKNFLSSKKIQRKFNQGGDDMTQTLINQMQEEIDSWAIRWCYYHFKFDAFCVYPVKSYIDNIGRDGTGVHCGRVGSKFKNKRLNKSKEVHAPNKIELNNKIMDNFRKVYKKQLLKLIIARVLKNIGLSNFYKKLRYKR